MMFTTARTPWCLSLFFIFMSLTLQGADEPIEKAIPKGIMQNLIDARYVAICVDDPNGKEDEVVATEVLYSEGKPDYLKGKLNWFKAEKVLYIEFTPRLKPPDPNNPDSVSYGPFYSVMTIKNDAIPHRDENSNLVSVGIERIRRWIKANKKLPNK